MNWTMVGALGELLGALVVVASVVYLAAPVRHNSAVARSDVLRTFTLERSRWTREMSSSPYAATWAKVFYDRVTSSELSPEEMLRIRTGYLSILYLVESAYRSWQQGILTRQELDAVAVWNTAFFNTPFFGESWPRWRERELPRDFVEWLEASVPQFRALE